MSIIYKGLNPKHHYGLCILTINGELITANGKHFQAIQIPKPHGRLIDGDELLGFFMNHAWDWSSVDGITTTTALKQMISDLKHAPTILESEE